MHWQVSGGGCKNPPSAACGVGRRCCQSVACGAGRIGYQPGGCGACRMGHQPGGCGACHKSPLAGGVQPLPRKGREGSNTAGWRKGQITAENLILLPSCPPTLLPGLAVVSRTRPPPHFLDPSCGPSMSPSYLLDSVVLHLGICFRLIDTMVVRREQLRKVTVTKL
jgi:hypothetical protein